jgi:ABC-2 type transport system ATP-binding protein
VTGFLGPNGAGKTTTLRMLLGLVAPTSGEVLVNGVPYSALPDPSRLVGAVLESSGFHPGRSAREHLRIVATTAGVPHSKVDDVLDFVGLSAVAGRKVGGYSMGMRQRLELARALLGDPQVLVLDEPANGLDPQGIAWLRGVLRSFAAEGRTVLISSHLLAEAAQTVDDVIVLNAGRLAGQGRLNELLERAKGEIHVRTLEPDRLVGVLQAAGIAATRQMADWVAAEGATAEEVGRAMAAAQIVVLEMSAEGESLEHLFFSLTEHP